MTMLIAVLVGLTVLVINLIFLGSWYRARHRVQKYQRIGLLAGGVLIASEVLILMALSVEGTQMMILPVLMMDIFAFIKIVSFTIMGVHYSAQLGLASFPLLLRNRWPYASEPVEQQALEADPDADSDPPQEEPIEPTQPAVETEPLTAVDESPPLPQRVDFTQACLATLLVAAGGVAYSVALLLITKPTISQAAQDALGGDVDDPVRLSTLLAVAAIAFAEEIVFRLGIQNWFAYKCDWTGDKYWIAITLSTGIWTLAHVGTLEPDWVKFLQVFPFGIALGVLYKKYGAESAITAHVLFNLILVPLATYLFVS